MRRKFVGFLLCAAMTATLLAGCGGGSDTKKETDAPAAATEGTKAAADSKAAEDTKAAEGNTQAPAASGELIKIGIINNDTSESGYRVANDRDLQRKFTEENGYDATFAYGKTNDEQVAAANKMIQDGVDYLAIAAANTSGWDKVLQDAKDAGIRVILYDRVIDADEEFYAASIVSDMAKEGETAANWLKDQNLESYNIIHLQGQMGSSAQVGRSEALVNMAQAEGWNIVTQQCADWNAETAQQIVQSVIDAGTDFNVIYAENDNMADGAVKALDKAGIKHGVGEKVVIMGFDCNTFALENVMNGTWNYDGQCNPYQADMIDEVIKNLENGQEPAQKTIIMEEVGFDQSNVTQEVIDQFGI
ncbi:MAG: substrate-binding domain-containing protein [Lachnospiraceae bacterium]|nr:substrate-binding domain-containing protein [Lachnospiraceae bacterium]